ncbi:MAG: glycosyl transferase [Paracoccus sp. (in: a-proteobacteria)]|uniref:glycosyl transferase n=1 Tax=Paracoccus sp. TaxID=267 RepID=UPI0026E0CC7B|nr:glycosyl transferase [Paracoccus sp. (in: a-proteobacteria)]MDO5620924.1 glycosyl transferase [Paracoccus sp. (in: a-proteobacteria)]
MHHSDRPLSRKLVRLGAMALGRSRAHRQDLWPGLHIDRASGQVTWRGRDLLTLQPAAQIMPRRDLLAVVGSGPSLKDQHIEALDGCAILCNGAASLAGRIRPLAVAVEDERFVFRHHAMLAALSPEIPLLLSPAALRAWAERGTEPLQDRAVALIDNLAKPVNLPRRKLSDPALSPVLIRKSGAALSINPDQGVVITGTVAFSALQFALAAGPDAILLAGIDLTNDSQPRFYEGADTAPSGLSSGLDRILAGFALARALAERRGIRLTCASPVSALLSIGYPHDQRLG